ncbi:lipase family protein [Leucobacter ruminantium]|uniref:Alpha/beta hydrolase n=1 Tax=Leucobacter ruminantium TaxID=1289170 RepID=A0A939LS59_9MICO|nr:lipase family protein [Leucobacter ruminantium]MBO1803905.1 alpha/beta hydrolase [Leucobacter ruminantium]
MTHSAAHSTTPLRIMLGLSSVLAGVALILAPLSPQAIAVIVGIGLSLTGVALLLRAGRDRHEHRDALSASGIGLGFVVLALGTIIALWPSLGAPGLAALIGAALIAHGLFSALRALRAAASDRASEIIAAAATVIFGALTFAWPVLTLTVFRYALGAWFVFFGLRALVGLLPRKGSLAAPAAAGTRHPVLRRWTRTIGSVAALVVAVAFAWGSGSILGGVPLPEPDGFYTAPSQVPDEPGRLLRSEPLTTGVPAGAEAWKILYTTTHPDGSPAVSSGTVIAPKQRGKTPLPLLTISHGTTGVVPKCAPSLSATPFADGAGAALAEMVTEHGWAGVISDYIGLGTEGPHPYLIGEAEARNVLDASRAVQQLGHIRTTTDTVVWGHSQGGQGALWTGQIAEDYAPELTVKGIAAFAPASDLFGLAEIEKTEVGGKTVSAYIASTWDRIYPDLELEQHLTPGSAGPVEQIADHCFDGRDALAALLRGSQVPNQIFPDSVLDGPFGDRLKAQEPKGPFPAPVMVAQGLADPLVKPQMQHDWVEGRCRAGEQIDYRTFPGLSHNTLVAADSPLTPQIVQWTLDRWNGKAATPNCPAG